MEWVEYVTVIGSHTFLFGLTALLTYVSIKGTVDYVWLYSKQGGRNWYPVGWSIAAAIVCTQNVQPKFNE